MLNCTRIFYYINLELAIMPDKINLILEKTLDSVDEATALQNPEDAIKEENIVAAQQTLDTYLEIANQRTTQELNAFHNEIWQELFFPGTTQYASLMAREDQCPWNYRPRPNATSAQYLTTRGQFAYPQRNSRNLNTAAFVGQRIPSRLQDLINRDSQEMLSANEEIRLLEQTSHINSDVEHANSDTDSGVEYSDSESESESESDANALTYRHRPGR